MASLKSGPEAAARTPQRPRGHNRVASLLDAAAAIFTRDGYDAATMTAIAAEAGAAIGSLYQFFPTKPLLADALYRRELDALMATLAGAGEAVLTVPYSLDMIADRMFAALIAFFASRPALSIVADRRDAGATRKATTRPGLREQLVNVMGRAEPQPSPQQAVHAAALVLRMMKAAIAIQVHEDPGADELIEDIRAMLRWRLSA